MKPKRKNTERLYSYYVYGRLRVGQGNNSGFDGEIKAKSPEEAKRALKRVYHHVTFLALNEAV